MLTSCVGVTKDWYGDATLRRGGKKARRWQRSLTGQHPLQLSVPGSHRGSLASLDDLQVFHRSRSMCSMKLDSRLDTISLNMELLGGAGSEKSSDDGVRALV
jgi:hypothetical protein